MGKDRKGGWAQARIAGSHRAYGITTRAQHLTAAALLAAVGSAYAQAYPVKSVRVIVPYAPAGGTDIIMRSLAHKNG